MTGFFDSQVGGKAYSGGWLLIFGKYPVIVTAPSSALVSRVKPPL